MEKITTVYHLYYVYEYDNGYEDVRLLGTFSSENKAQAALSTFKKIPEFREIMSNFTISEDRVNLLGWTEGFTTIS